MDDRIIVGRVCWMDRKFMDGMDDLVERWIEELLDGQKGYCWNE